MHAFSGSTLCLRFVCLRWLEMNKEDPWESMVQWIGPRRVRTYGNPALLGHNLAMRTLAQQTDGRKGHGSSGL